MVDHCTSCWKKLSQISKVLNPSLFDQEKYTPSVGMGSVVMLYCEDGDFCTDGHNSMLSKAFNIHSYMYHVSLMLDTLIVLDHRDGRSPLSGPLYKVQRTPVKRVIGIGVGSVRCACRGIINWNTL